MKAIWGWQTRRVSKGVAPAWRKTWGLQISYVPRSLQLSALRL